MDGNPAPGPEASGDGWQDDNNKNSDNKNSDNKNSDSKDNKGSQAGMGSWSPPGASPWGQPAPARADQQDRAQAHPWSAPRMNEGGPGAGYPWGQPPPAPPANPWAAPGGGPEAIGSPDEARPDEAAGATSDDPGPGQPEPKRPRQIPLGFAAALVATALVSGGAGAAIAVAVDNHSAASPGAAALPAAAPNGPASSSGLNVQAIANRVDAATVDITAAGPGGQDEGTGMILTSTGIVLTNNHVVAGSTQLSAQVDGAGRSYPASVIGVDVAQDVALVQLRDGTSFHSVTIGKSQTMNVGDQVVAIGNALDLPGPETVTSGIISAVDRAITVNDPATGSTESLADMFQTSAAISSGNSGGPLVNAAGQVIAMDTAEASSDASGETASDVGFAIPIDRAMSIARQIQAGHASSTIQIGAQPETGVGVVSVACAEGLDGCLPLGFGSFSLGPGFYQAPVSRGAVVNGVEQGSPAAATGLGVGDVITSFDGTSITSPDQLTAVVNRLKVGAGVSVGWVTPNGQHQSDTFRLVAAPTP